LVCQLSDTSLMAYSKASHEFFEFDTRKERWIEFLKPPRKMRRPVAMIPMGKKRVGVLCQQNLFILDKKKKAWKGVGIDENYQSFSVQADGPLVCWDEMRHTLHIFEGVKHIFWSHRDGWQSIAQLPEPYNGDGLRYTSCVWNPCGMNPDRIWLMGAITNNNYFPDILVLDVGQNVCATIEGCLPSAIHSTGMAVFPDCMVIIPTEYTRPTEDVWVIHANANSPKDFTLTVLDQQWPEWIDSRPPRNIANKCTMLRTGTEIHIMNGTSHIVARLL